MIKGVNKQIIEVSDTGNKYFEKAILFVRPQYMNENEHGLRKEANRMLEGIGDPPLRSKKLSLRQKAIKTRLYIRIISASVFTIAFVLLCYLITKIF